MRIDPSTHPLNTFVLSSSSTQTGSGAAVSPVQQDISALLEKIMVVHADYSFYDSKVLPRHFEPQAGVWKQWLTPADNQGSCGSCWSFASVGALSDRFNILLRKVILRESLSILSPTICNDILAILLNEDQQLIETVQHPFALAGKTLETLACHGNSLVTACLYLMFQGTTTDRCMAYTLPVASSYAQYKSTKLNWGFPLENSIYFTNPDNRLYDFTQFNEDQTLGTCGFYNENAQRPFPFCNDYLRVNSTKNYGSAQQHFQALLVYSVKGMVNIMMDIYKWGPVCSAFTVYEDFYDFDPKGDSVYVHDATRTNLVGGHAVEIVGWGEMNGKPFWWIKNSWGTEYGHNGYFRFLRGTDQCSLESNVVSMLPDLFFTLDRVSEVRALEKRLTDLNIFKVHYTPEFMTLQDNIAKTFQPITPSRTSTGTDLQEVMRNVRRQDFMAQQLPLLQFHALSRIGYQTTDVLTPTGYNSNVYRVMPGLFLGAPSPTLLPYTRDFVAGQLPVVPPAPVSLVRPWSMASFLLVLMLSCVVVTGLLWKKL